MEDEKEQENTPIAEFKKRFGELSKRDSKWNAAKSHDVVKATLEAIQNMDGAYIVLTLDQATVLEALLHPTVKNQIAVIEKIIADAGGKLDEKTSAAIKTMLNPASVQKQIENAQKPGKFRLSDVID